MREGMWLVVAIVGLAWASESQAQFGFGSSNGGRTTRLSSPAVTGQISPNTHVSSTFRLRDLFPNLNPFSNRNPVGRSSVPNPGSNDYLKNFGYKRLY